MSVMVDELRQDVIFALRQLRRAPAFTLVAAATLALGIGANSAIFALVDATLLRPLPYAAPEGLATIWETAASTPRGLASPLNITDWQTRGRSFDRIAGYAPAVGSMVMAGSDGNATR
jgi:putative ABC transport system permease protein